MRMEDKIEQRKAVNNGGGYLRRISNFEILRIVAMIAIIFSHYFLCSQINTSNLSFGATVWYVGGSSFGQFGVVIFIYIFAAYLRKYGGSKLKIKTDVLIVILSLIAIFLCKALTIIVLNNKLNIEYDANRFSALQSIFVLIMSVACFEIAIKCKPFTNKTINYIAKSTFGVYLIHDNPFIREVLWCRIFKVASFAEGNFAIFVLHSFITVAIVFCCCTLIDILRRFIEKPVSRAYDKLAAKLLNSRLAVKIKTFLHGLDSDE